MHQCCIYLRTTTLIPHIYSLRSPRPPTFPISLQSTSRLSHSTDTAKAQPGYELRPFLLCHTAWLTSLWLTCHHGSYASSTHLGYVLVLYPPVLSRGSNRTLIHFVFSPPCSYAIATSNEFKPKLRAHVVRLNSSIEVPPEHNNARGKLNADKKLTAVARNPQCDFTCNFHKLEQTRI